MALKPVLIKREIHDTYHRVIGYHYEPLRDTYHRIVYEDSDIDSNKNDKQ